jgi:hypothetical protein
VLDYIASHAVQQLGEEIKPSQTIHQRRPLRTGLGLLLFTSGTVSVLADLANSLFCFNKNIALAFQSNSDKWAGYWLCC